MESCQPHPAPLPAPASMAERIEWLQLYRSRRVGPVTFLRLMREYGSSGAALAGLPKIARDAGVRDYAVFAHRDAAGEMQAGLDAGAQLLCLGDPAYPPLLATIPDPPPVLWALGNIDLGTRAAVAMVGARNASSLGLRMATRLSAGVSKRGFVVVSGMARGIDAAAHMAGISGGTIAVQAGGVDVVYPRENAGLAQEITRHGLHLSEMPVGLVPQARHFPRRNRIIAGIARALVVIEGASRSGSLITAKDALDQGREVMAVPGNPLDGRAAGCNMLIRDGATLVRSADDICVPLKVDGAIRRGRAPPADPQSPPATAGDLTRTILALLGPNPVQEDVLIQQTRRPANQVLATLVDLELACKIERSEGGSVSLAGQGQGV